MLVKFLPQEIFSLHDSFLIESNFVCTEPNTLLWPITSKYRQPIRSSKYVWPARKAGNSFKQVINGKMALDFLAKGQRNRKKTQ